MPDSWYVVKVTSGREPLIARNIGWEVVRSNLEDQFGRIIAIAKYPGYLLINMDLTGEAMRLVRETPGVTDFTGAAGKPAPIEPKEVVRMLGKTG